MGINIFKILLPCFIIGLFVSPWAKAAACPEYIIEELYSPDANNTYQPYYLDHSFNRYHLAQDGQAFLDGNYGVLQSKWGIEYLYPVYQDMMGKKITPDVKNALLKYYQSNGNASYAENNDKTSSLDQWLQARKLVDPGNISLKTEVCGGGWMCYENCLGDTFVTAAQALKDRLNIYNKEEMQAWLSGQDSVFASCAGSTSQINSKPDRAIFKASIKDIVKNSHNSVGNFFNGIISGIGNFFARANQWISALFNPKSGNTERTPEPETPKNVAASQQNPPQSTEEVKPSEHAELLRYDKEYQDAAKLFYEGDYAGAIEKFQLIENNPKNPWKALAALARGRAYIRMGNSGSNSLGFEDYQQFENDNFLLAKKQFQAILDNPDLAAVHNGARELMDYVNVRIDPRQRLVDAVLAVENPSNPNEVIRNLDDISMVWYYDLNLYPNGRDDVDQDNEAFVKKNGTDFVQWYYVWTSPKDNFDYALNKYHQNKSLPWLLACLKTLPKDSAYKEEIINDAAKIKNDSAAFLTAKYYSLQLESNPGIIRQESDAVLQKLSANGNKDVIAYDFFSDLRMSAATSLEDIVKHSDRSVVVLKNGDIDSEKVGLKTFDPNMNQLFDQSVPLREWARIALQQPFFSAEANKYFQLTTFVRASMLGEWNIVSEMAQSLSAGDAQLKTDLAPYLSAKNDEERKFTAAFFMLDYPGLHKDLNAGVDAYLIDQTPLTAGTATGYSHFWWSSDTATTDLSVSADFIPAQDIQEATQEKSILDAILPINYFCQTIINYGTAHPGDPRVPEALAQAVVGTRFAAQKDDQTADLSKQAFTILHNNYPSSSWAKQTPYWYGNENY